jgi:hypothetical protein
MCNLRGLLNYLTVTLNKEFHSANHKLQRHIQVGEKIYRYLHTHDTDHTLEPREVEHSVIIVCFSTAIVFFFSK